MMTLTFFDNVEVPISKVTIGTVVQQVSFDGRYRTPIQEYGHIVGFSQNCTKETILMVKWAGNNDWVQIHSTNVRILLAD